MRNLGDFSSRDYTFESMDCYGPLSRPHSYAQAIFVEHEKKNTLQTHGAWLDSMCSPKLKFGLG